MTDQPDPTAHLQAMFEDARAYCLARFNYSPNAYVSPEARERHIDSDAHNAALEPRFAVPWNAGYARGLAAGRSQATEGWEREWAIAGKGFPGYPFHDEERMRAFAACHPEAVIVSRLASPWEPADPAGGAS